MKIHFYIGIAVIMAAEVLMFMGVEPVATWFTPIVWWGYILAADALVKKVRGRSLIVDRTADFLIMLVLSYLLWLVFEFYNLFLKNWYYINLPENTYLKQLGYFLSFASILPALFITAQLIKTIPFVKKAKGKKIKLSSSMLGFLIVLGIFCLIYPLRYPSPYIFAMVWLGFIFLLEPINYLWKRSSILLQLEKGDYTNFIAFLASGYICGLLWEFWNYWAVAKWIYTVPFMPEIKIFEMPVAGFLGFGPFALEMYALYNFCLTLFGLRGKQLQAELDKLPESG